MIIDLNSLIDETVRVLLRIACRTLQEEGSHLPTAILHTMGGMIPIVLPFKNDQQRRALVEQVKKQALAKAAYAVTTITCGRIVDSRTGREQESLILATSIQRGRPHVVVQPFARDADRRVTGFGEAIEGERAAMPGQMMILPDWDKEVWH
jgi:hypothetical protein